MWHKFFSDLEYNFWRFWSQTRIFFGFGSTERISEVLGELGIGKVVVLTDKEVSKLNFFKAICEKLEGYICSVEYIGWESDYDDVVRISRKLSHGGVEGLVAVGGGSVLDGSKIAAVLAKNSISPEELKSLHVVPENPIPLLCVPTTFGTGSEVNMYSHLKLESGKKIAYKRDFLTPTVAFIDPSVVFETPHKLRMFSAVDAMCHCLEVLSLRRERSPIQEVLALHGLKLLLEYFKMYVSNPDDACVSAIALASLIGGICIHNSRTGIVHTLATPYARVSNLPHSVSLLPFLGIFLDELKNWLLEKIGAEILGSVSEMIEFVYSQVDRNFYIKSANKDEIREMVDYCTKDVVLFKENPFSLSSDLIEELYVKYLEL